MPIRPNKIPVPELRTVEECLAYMKAEALTLRKHSAGRRGRPVNPVTAYIYASVWLSVIKRLEAILQQNRE